MKRPGGKTQYHGFVNQENEGDVKAMALSKKIQSVRETARESRERERLETVGGGGGMFGGGGGKSAKEKRAEMMKTVRESLVTVAGGPWPIAQLSLIAFGNLESPLLRLDFGSEQIKIRFFDDVARE